MKTEWVNFTASISVMHEDGAPYPWTARADLMGIFCGKSGALEASAENKEAAVDDFLQWLRTKMLDG